MTQVIRLLFAALCLPTFLFAATAQSFEANIQALEHSTNTNIGVYAINTGNGETLAHRAEQRFPFQSTFKLIGVAALLDQTRDNPAMLQEVIPYTQQDITFWSPITKRHIDTGMTLKALAEAAISYSDNTAINLILRKIGGPAAVTRYAHKLGNHSFNLQHIEAHLNSNPNNPSDTATPKDMALALQKLALGKSLPEPSRTLLMTWLRNNTTSYRRMRASAPLAWTVADRTGSGAYGVANDIGVMWSPNCKPIVIAIFTNQNTPSARGRDDIIAQTTSLLLNTFTQSDQCLKQTYY